MINTILVEDDLYIQKHFVDCLAADGEFHLVGVFRDAFEAEKHCNATVKLVLMDVQTQHKHSGLAAAERIKKAFPQIKIVVATSLVDPEVLQRAKLGAADSLWYKDHGTEALMSVVKRSDSLLSRALPIRKSLISWVSPKTAFAGTWIIWWKRVALKAENRWLQRPLKTSSW